jgi:SSS family solute:Na+ symporter
MKIPDIIILVVYLAGIVLFGSSFYRKNRSPAAFTLGNNKLPAWVISLSIFATYVSSISYLAIPGQSFQSDWNVFAFSLSIPLSTFMAVKYFVPLYRSVNSPSAYTYLEIRFGKWARIYASAMYLLTQLMRTGTILFLMALMLHVITGWSIMAIILVTGLSVMLYSMAGGIQAVVWTDAVQAVILVAGALVSAGVLLFSLPEGPAQLFSIAGEHHKFSLGSFGTELDRSTFWVVLIYGVTINLQNYGIDQNYVQRYMAAGSDKDARNSVLFGSLLYIPVSMVFLFIGTGLFTYYKANPGLLPPGISGDKVFPWFMVNGLPTGLTGLLIASVFAAGMSTVSTSINSSATVILTDYLKIPPSGAGNDKRAMRVLLTASMVFSLLGMSVAVAMIDVQSVLDSWWKLASVFSGGMLGLFLLGYFTRHIGKYAAMAGVAAGVLLIGWMGLSPLFLNTGPGQKLISPFHGYLSIVFGTMAVFLFGFLAGILLNRIKQFRRGKRIS